MAGTFQITVAEARGLVSIPADLDRLAIVVGPSSVGAGLTPFFTGGSAAVAAVGYGDAADALTQVIEQRLPGGSGTKFPAAAYITPGTTAGSYGVLDVSGVTGTAIVETGAPTPLGTYEARLKFIAGGTLGTSGMTVQWSLDGGRNYSPTTALGTAQFFAIPNSGVRFDFEPPTAALVTAVNDAKAQQNAHVVETAGGVHGAADNADVVATADAVTDDDCVVLINAVCAAYELHRVKTAGAVHGAADNTDALTILVAAVTPYDAILRYLDWKAQYNAHVINVTAAIHGLADADEQTTAPTPSAGTFIAGDVIKCRTFAPAPIGADIDAAGVALAASTADCAYLIFPFPMTAATLAPHVTTLLNALKAVGKRPTAIVRSRDPLYDMNFAISNVTNTNPAVITVPSTATLATGQVVTIAGVLGSVGVNGNLPVTVLNGTTFSVPVAAGGAYTSGGTVTENDAAWNTNVTAEWANFADSRIHRRDAYGLLTDAMTTRQYQRSDIAQFAADAVRVGVFGWPCCPADATTGLGGVPNFSLVDANGNTVGHDEGPRGASSGMSDITQGNRGGCQQRLADPSTREAVFNTPGPWVLFSSGEAIQTLPVRTLANAMERDAVAAGIPSLGSGGLVFTSTGPGTGVLDGASRASVQSQVFAALSAKYGLFIDNAKDAALDTGLVQIPGPVTVSGGNILAISCTIAPHPKGFLGSLAFTFAIQQ